MDRQPIQVSEFWNETLRALERDGLLLCSAGENGAYNVMTIGWMIGGVAWGKPVLTVFVRPQHHTFRLLEETGVFTVNVLPPEFHQAIQVCGTLSGRQVDKFARTGLTPLPAQRVRAPIIEQGVIHYECRVVHRNDVIPSQLTEDIPTSGYREGGVHRIYYGHVVAAYATVEAQERLRD